MTNRSSIESCASIQGQSVFEIAYGTWDSTWAGPSLQHALVTTKLSYERVGVATQYEVLGIFIR
jgi:hypothetical protein